MCVQPGRGAAKISLLFSLRRVFLRISACFAVLCLVSGTQVPGSEEGRVLKEPFPAFYFTAHYRRWLAKEAAKPYWAHSQEERQQLERDVRNSRPLVLNDDILAFYGHPDSPYMGILGRYTKEELNAQLENLGAEYDQVNGSRGVRKAFYLIYGTVQPKGKIGYISEKTLKEYLDFAQENDILVFIDHQIGRYDPVDSLKELLPYLEYPNVHLALDPEWRTAQPMTVIGNVTAEELNRAQEEMSRYIEENRISGERMLVVHQFDWRMIKNRDKVETGYKQVNLVHCADGFGSPALKRNTYAYNALAANMPLKGFKLFYNFQIPGAGYDDPLLSPEEVNSLDPRPSLVIYQ
ncbi:MAG: hypothetical protein LBI67_09245 [Treponema sp.]|jgi:hypothetical protein|nr:hypothetical protein [Treponema sp.]